jgi:hypothetical protein
MPTALALPEGYAPSNLHLAPSVKARFVDSDMFDICKRIAHVSRQLFIVQLEEKDPSRIQRGTPPVNYVIMEMGIDGGAYLVYKLRPGEPLDARVIEKVEYMLRVPMDKRFEEAERLEREAEEQIRQDAIDETYEKVGAAFQRQLWHDGFIEHRRTSYATKGVAQPRRHR